MIKNIFLKFLLVLPFFIEAQEPAENGIWLLKDKQFLEGPAYQNGIPKILTTNGTLSNYNLAMTTSLGAKDTIETENFEAVQDYTLLSMTPKGRQKKVYLNVFLPNKLLVREVTMSAQGDVSNPAIRIIDSLQFIQDGKQLIFTRHYKGENKPDGNKDYRIVGTYKKVTEQELANETATGKGVTWTKELTWQQILEKARLENKYVFVDCYATWCAPCKKMDLEVYPLNWVGETMRKNFLSVRVQMDTAKNDPADIQLTYPIARLLEKQYKIDGLPTYLFLNGKGELVDKSMGYLEPSEFISSLENAADPEKQVYTRYRLGIDGRLKPEELKSVIDQLLDQRYDDKEGAKALMRIYIEKKIYSLSDKELLTKDNIEEIFNYWSAVKSTDRIFNLLYHNPEGVNQILGKKKGEDYVQLFLSSIILDEEVFSAVTKSNLNKSTPDWGKLKKKIAQKYGESYAVRPILEAQLWWYKKHKQWELYSNYFFQQVQIEIPRMKAADDPTKPMNDMYGMANYLNDAAFKIFQYSNNKKQLMAALDWSAQAIKIAEAQNMGGPGRAILATYDTYGGLLYKLGRTSEAIAYYKTKIMDRLPKNIEKGGWASQNFQLMQEGKPTWKNEN